MRRILRLTLAALALALGASTFDDARAQSTGDDAFSDEKIDAFLFQDQYGVKGSGEANRLLVELNPAFYAELRRLSRRLHFARPEDRIAVTSELNDLNGRLLSWIMNETRSAPLDALDARLASERAALQAAERTNPNICIASSWSEDRAAMALYEALPDVSLALSVAGLRVVAAARARPTTHPPLDEAMVRRYMAALEVAGVSQEGIKALSSEEELAKLAPTERCDLTRRSLAVLAALPDDARGPFLNFQYTGDDGSDR